jgi:hypothetical protein
LCALPGETRVRQIKLDDVPTDKHAVPGLLRRKNAEPCEFEVSNAAERAVVLTVEALASCFTVRTKLVTQEHGERFRDHMADVLVAISR